MPANRPATPRTQSLRPLFSWMTRTAPFGFCATAHAPCSSPLRPGPRDRARWPRCSRPRRRRALGRGAGRGAPARSVRWARCSACSPRMRRSVRSPRWRRRRSARVCAAPRFWTASRPRGRWRSLLRCSAAKGSRQRVCPGLLKCGWRCAWTANTGRMTGPADRSALEGRVAVVAGATRGAGRGIAAALGEAGATVVCTGRSSASGNLQSDYDRPETIEETAELVTTLGGVGVAVAVDHLDPAQVLDLADRLRGRLRRHRHPGQRHLGRRGSQGAAVVVEQADVGTRPRCTVCGRCGSVSRPT